MPPHAASHRMANFRHYTNVPIALTREGKPSLGILGAGQLLAEDLTRAELNKLLQELAKKPELPRIRQLLGMEEPAAKQKW